MFFSQPIHCFSENKTSKNTNRWQLSALTARQSSEYFLKDRTFCTVLKGYDLAFFSWFLLVQRASLMSNDLGMVSASWHCHKPSWHGDSGLIILLRVLDILKQCGKQVNLLSSLHYRNKIHLYVTDCMSYYEYYPILSEHRFYLSPEFFLIL